MTKKFALYTVKSRASNEQRDAIRAEMEDSPATIARHAAAARV